MTEWSQDENEGDALFRADALAQGYLDDDPHEPGNGRGLWAYYSDNGMVHPVVLRREIPLREMTNYQPGIEEMDCGD